MNDQENIKQIREKVEPCQSCGGRGYFMKLPTLEHCGCVNADLPLPELTEGRIIFKLKGENAD